MVRMTNVKVYDLEESIRASKYPYSTSTMLTSSEMTDTVIKLAQCPKGTGHDQFLTGIRVNFDLTFSIKAWTEAERYRFLEFVSSQSTMHRLTQFDLKAQYNSYVDRRVVEIMQELAGKYNETHDTEDFLKAVYTNPCGFELTARMTTNYRSLKTIYSQRKNHRLPEWREFCEEIKKLPYAKELIIGDEDTKGETV